MSTMFTLLVFYRIVTGKPKFCPGFAHRKRMEGEFVTPVLSYKPSRTDRDLGPGLAHNKI